MTDEPTYYLNAGAQSAAPAALVRRAATAGPAKYAVSGAAARHASAGGLHLAADADRQDPLLRHCRRGAGFGLGLCRDALARPRDLFCPRRLRHGHVPDAPGGGRRIAGLYVVFVVERAAVVLVGHPAFRLGYAAGGAGARPAGAGFRLVCLPLENQRRLFFDYDPGAHLRRDAAVFP